MNRYAAIVAAEERLPRLMAAIDEDEMAEALDGLPYDAFVELDERPAQFDRYYRYNGAASPVGWHMLMRRVRNDASFNLFDRLAR